MSLGIIIEESQTQYMHEQGLHTSGVLLVPLGIKSRGTVAFLVTFDRSPPDSREACTDLEESVIYRSQGVIRSTSTMELNEERREEEFHSKTENGTELT